MLPTTSTRACSTGCPVVETTRPSTSASAARGASRESRAAAHPAGHERPDRGRRGRGWSRGRGWGIHGFGVHGGQGRGAAAAAQNRDAARSLAGRISRQVVHQPVSMVSTNSAGSSSRRISAAKPAWS